MDLRLRKLRARLATAPAGWVALATLSAGVAALATSAELLPGGAVLGIYAALFVPYAVALVGAREGRIPFWGLAAAAMLARLLLLPTAPLLSDDIFRYVWDGRVALSGTNPFLHPPAAEALAHLRDASIWPNINHPDVPTIYPPGAQYLFALNALVGGGILGMKGLFVAIEAACIAAVGWMLQDRWDRGTLRVAFVAYALNPLVFVEVAWSGHLDVVAWGLLAVGLVAWQTGTQPRREAFAALAVGTSAAVKFLGLAALPLLAIDRGDDGNRHPLGRRLATCTAISGIVVASYLPMLGAGAKLFSGFGTYAASWRGNDGPYRAVRALSISTIEAWARTDQRTDGQILIDFDQLDGLYRSLGWTKAWRGESLPDTTFVSERFANNLGKWVALSAVAWVGFWCLLAGRRPLSGVALLLFTLYLFAPVLHPWYVAWLVPFAALRERKTGLVFSFTVLAAYLAWLSDQTGGPWHVPNWAVAAEYGLVLLAFWFEASLTADRDPGAPGNG